MQDLFVPLFNGLALGLLLFLLSAGFTLIYSMLGVLNFAHAAFYMLGAYFAYSLSAHWGFLAALLLAPLLCAVLGGVFEYFVLRHVHQDGHVAELLLTYGLGLIIWELVQIYWGKGAVNYLIPSAFDALSWSVAGLRLSAYRLFAMLLSCAVMGALWLVLRFTRWGMLMRAALSHPHMLEALGYHTALLYAAVFALGSALAGLAGVLAGNLLLTEPGMAQQLGPIIFVIVVVGGLGSLGGAFIASILLGLMQSMAVAWGGLWAQFSSVLPFALMVLFLLLRPRGLMGMRDA